MDTQSIPPPGRGRGVFRPRHRGFTLVELLVVIAIISVLASLLLPALQGAVDAARTTACASNMRQIGLGLSQYESEWGILHPGYGIGGSVYAGYRWYKVREGLVGYILDVEPDASDMPTGFAANWGAGTILACPLRGRVKVNDTVINYASNLFYKSGRYTSADIVNPSDKVYLGETPASANFWYYNGPNKYAQNGIARPHDNFSRMNGLCVAGNIRGVRWADYCYAEWPLNAYCLDGTAQP